jgi:DNA topoisomerase-1
MKSHLSPDEFKLYELIWKRFVSSQMSDAVYDTLKVDIKASAYMFRASGRTVKFKGFLEVYAIEENDEKKDDSENRLPKLGVGDLLDLIQLLPSQHFTEPPPRFNEASLIKALEEHGIGRPSTYAPIIKTIQDRNYVRLDTRRFFPTKLGRLVNTALKEHFPEIVNIEFTANIEEKLDDVAEGKVKWVKVIDDFFIPFSKALAKAETDMPRMKVQPETTDQVCPKCKSPMVIRESRRGRFMACSAFPNCRTTFSIDKEGKIVEKPQPEMTSEKCEKCGSPMVKRVGKRGPFLACSAFPKCRNIKKWKQAETK